MLSQIEIETIQIMDRWRQEKCSVLEDESINNLAKSQACTIPQCWDIPQKVSQKFIELSMEIPYLCPSEGHEYGR